MAYRFNARQKKLPFGIYGPDDQGRGSLAAARQKRDAAKTLIAQGIDPGTAKKEVKQEKAAAQLFASRATSGLPLRKRHAETSPSRRWSSISRPCRTKAS